MIPLHIRGSILNSFATTTLYSILPVPMPRHIVSTSRRQRSRFAGAKPKAGTAILEGRASILCPSARLVLDYVDPPEAFGCGCDFQWRSDSLHPPSGQRR